MDLGQAETNVAPGQVTGKAHQRSMIDERSRVKDKNVGGQIGR
jgi:hypothetical protein